MKYYFRHPCTRVAKLIRRKDKTSTVKPIDIWRLAKKQKCRCALTNRILTNENVSADHIICLAHGGKSEINNIRLVTKEVNVARHLLNDKDFLQLCNDVVNHLTIK